VQAGQYDPKAREFAEKAGERPVLAGRVAFFAG